MASMAEKVNTLALALTQLTQDPSERYAICAIVLEMQRFQLSGLFEIKHADQEKQ